MCARLYTLVHAAVHRCRWSCLRTVRWSGVVLCAEVGSAGDMHRQWVQGAAPWRHASLAARGPLIRDHIQAAMIEAQLGELHPRWRPLPEVWVTQPVKGIIDLVLESDDEREPLVAMEAQSELRRLEQQIRWAHAKAQALEQARGRPVSRLLLLRNTRHTRAVVAEHAETVLAAYPATAADAYAALTGERPWPGAAILWVDVVHGRATMRAAPPRSITVGR